MDEHPITMNVYSRATAQWFTNVEDLQKEAVKALKNVKMVPDVCKYTLPEKRLHTELMT